MFQGQLSLVLQGYLAHKKQPPAPRTTTGPWALSRCRVLGGAFSYERDTPAKQANRKWYNSQFKNNCFAEMCSSSEAGSYLSRIDCCITQLEA